MFNKNLGEWPYFEDEEIDLVSSILKSGKVNYWTGNYGKEFEKNFEVWSNSNHALSIANGTLALIAAYSALGLKKDDEIITTPRTFIATASSAISLGIKTIFADVDKDSGLITNETIEPLITKKTKAISIVHIGGWPADMEKICKLAKAYNLLVIEDCAQAHGAQIKINDQFRSVGSFGDISAWSFCQDKIMTTGGEGGMITTNNTEYYEKIWSLRDHGKTLNSVFRKKHAWGFKWLHENFGSNLRMTEMQSALGILQLKKLKEWNEIRSRNANIIKEAIKDIGSIRVPFPKKDYKHAWYKFTCYVKPENLSTDWSRDRIAQEINQLGYPAFQGSCSEIYNEECFKKAGLSINNPLPIAQELGQTSLTFLVHPTIKHEQMHKYCDNIKHVLKKSLI